MHWILQNNIFNESAYDTLVETLRRFDIPFSEYKVVPLAGIIVPLDFDTRIAVDDSYTDPALAALQGPVICMGSYSMRHSAKKYGWTPGVFDLMEVGSFDQCMKHWAQFMLNGDSVVVPFKDAGWPSGEERFIRPTNDSKYFPGKLMEGDNFAHWQKQVCELGADDGSLLSGDTEIQVARPKKIFAEYRCWVVDDEIVTISMYKLGQRVIYENFDGGRGRLVKQFAERVLRAKDNKEAMILLPTLYGWKPARAFCLDVCETEDGWKVVEIGSINACGFYAANMTSLVMALNSCT